MNTLQLVRKQNRNTVSPPFYDVTQGYSSDGSVPDRIKFFNAKEYEDILTIDKLVTNPRRHSSAYNFSSHNNSQEQLTSNDKVRRVLIGARRNELRKQLTREEYCLSEEIREKYGGVINYPSVLASI
ncbi:unnamed protein product [Trichobilharzia regenti]|nr:unnamed protein product [Trichobilharzia regenti]